MHNGINAISSLDHSAADLPDSGFGEPRDRPHRRHRFWSHRTDIKKVLAFMGSVTSAPELFSSVCKSSSAPNRGLGLRRDEIGTEWDHHSDDCNRDDFSDASPQISKLGFQAGRSRSVLDSNGQVSTSFARSLIELMGTARSEQLRAVMLGKRYEYLTDFLLAVGPLALVRSSYRSVIEPALKTDAHGIVLIHNHPSGDPRPSSQDLKATKALVALTNALSLTLDDHLIVSRQAVFSMRQGKVIVQ